MKTLILLITISSGLVVANPTTVTDRNDLCTNEEAELEYDRDRFYELTLCLTKVLNATEFRHEILQAGDTSKVDAVITKVCKNLPEIVRCTNKYVSSIGPCMDQEERREKELWKDLRQMNMEFACGAGREHLITFIDEGGIQCIANHRNGISDCVNSKFPTLLKQQSDTQIVKTLALITKEDGKCNSLKEVETCVNSELVKCVEPSSLSIIRQYFSSLDVLFDCVNSSSPNEQNSPMSAEGSRPLPDRGNMEVLFKIQERMDHLLVASEQRMEAGEAADKKVIEYLEQHTASIEKIIHLLDNVIIPKLKKEKRRHLEH
ncbi:27 kDa hemolymph protein [Anabrus simplex]|uniref:27 kDa hemolymph protein n=1 Tax=Anabrus simplex TaxID=316456 RepID=UPI0035A387B8